MRGLALAVLLAAAAVGASSSMQLQAANECSMQQGLDSLQVLDVDAGIFVYPNFLSAEECEHLIAAAAPRLSRSSVVETQHNGTGVGVEHAIRTSSGAAFKRGEDEVIAAVEERIARWSLLPVSHQESLQVLQYGPGQQYRPHFDFFQDNTTVQNGGNRHTTVLVYLSDVEEGGETVFPLLPPAAGQEGDASLSECAAKHLAVKPRKGTALLWRNLTPEGQLEPRSLHAGCPVIKGTKYALAKWVRARPYVTIEELAARVAAYQAAQQQQQTQTAAAGADAQAQQHLSQLSQLLAVAVAR